MAKAIGEYTVEFDIPYSELLELGCTRIRMMRDVKASKLIKPSDKVVLEPKTGTLMLEPEQLAPIAKLDLDFADGFWQENPEGSNVLGFNPRVAGQTRQTLQSKGFTLVELLNNIAIAGLQSAIIENSKTLVPVLATKTAMPANQPISAYTVFMGSHGDMGKDWLAIRFGDFLLSLSVNGTADLYWSSDGTCNENSWELRKTFSNIPDVRSRNVLPSNIMGFGTSPLTAVRVDIIPMGRGHIWFKLNAPGFSFSDIYTHPEAVNNNGQYDITAAGKVVVLVPNSEEKSVSVQICPIGFKTSGIFTDAVWTIPYAPSEEPSGTIYSSTTNGTPAVNYALKTSAGDAWASNGTNRDIKVELTLSGDGTCTPFVDHYQLSFPEKTKTYTPDTIYISADEIESISVSDGEGWDDQTFDVTILDDGTNPDISTLAFRSEISAILKIDGVARGVYLCKKPAMAMSKGKNRLTFTGQNFGIAKIKEKKFFHPASFGGLTHPEAVRSVLMHAGFLTGDIVTDEDAVTLPDANLSGTEDSQGDIKSQPQFNSSVSDFLRWIIDNYSRWPLKFDADMKWYYQAPPAEVSSTLVFEDDGPDISNWNPWFAEESLAFEVEPPEANVVYLFGQADDGTVIGNYAVDANSVDTLLDPKPVNYIGRIKPTIIIDGTLSTPEILDGCLERLFNAARQAVIWVNWRGPFVPALRVDDFVTLENFGIVQVKSMESTAMSARAQEHSASTSYRGILVDAYNVWFPTLTYEYNFGRDATIRKKFLDELTDRINRAGGSDIKVKSITTAQQFDRAKVLDEILRGNVTWGTPIEV
jgi:hypothetical protein